MRLLSIALAFALLLVPAGPAGAARSTPHLDAVEDEVREREAALGDPVDRAEKRLLGTYSSVLRLLGKGTTSLKREVKLASKVVGRLLAGVPGDAEIELLLTGSLDGLLTDIEGLLDELDLDLLQAPEGKKKVKAAKATDAARRFLQMAWAEPDPKAGATGVAKTEKKYRKARKKVDQALRGGGGPQDDHVTTEKLEDFFETEPDLLTNQLLDPMYRILDALRGQAADGVTVQAAGGNALAITVAIDADGDGTRESTIGAQATFSGDPTSLEYDDFPVTFTASGRLPVFGTGSTTGTITAQGGGATPTIFFWEAESSYTDDDGYRYDTEEGYTIDLTFPRTPLYGYICTEIHSPAGKLISSFEVTYDTDEFGRMRTRVAGTTNGVAFDFTFP